MSSDPEDLGYQIEDQDPDDDPSCAANSEAGEEPDDDDFQPAWMDKFWSATQVPPAAGDPYRDFSDELGQADIYPDPPTFDKDEAIRLLQQGKNVLMFVDSDALEYLQYVMTPSEVKLYSLMIKHKWKVEELQDVIRLLSDPSFKREDISQNLHQRVQRLIEVNPTYA